MYKLILADDESIILRGLTKLLDWNSMGIEIAGQAANGAEAEKLIRTVNPDIALMDIRMPICSGLDVLEHIRRDSFETRVIFLSSHQDFSYAQQALRSGASNYLVKPVRAEELEQAVRQAISSFEQAIAEPPAHNIPEIQRVLDYISSHYNEDITLDKIARDIHMNPYYFSAFFKKNTGMNFKDCLTKIRMEKALNLLDKGNYKTYELAELVGFNDARYFSELFKKTYGVTPSRFVRKRT